MCPTLSMRFWWDNRGNGVPSRCCEMRDGLGAISQFPPEQHWALVKSTRNSAYMTNCGITSRPTIRGMSANFLRLVISPRKIGETLQSAISLAPAPTATTAIEPSVPWSLSLDPLNVVKICTSLTLLKRYGWHELYSKMQYTLWWKI